MQGECVDLRTFICQESDVDCEVTVLLGYAALLVTVSVLVTAVSTPRSQVEVEAHVISMCHSPQTGTVALQLEDGRIRKFLWGQSLTTS